MQRIRIKKDVVDSLLKEGKNYNEIAQIIGVTRSSAGRFCRKYYGCLTDRGKATRQSIPISNIEQQILFGGLLGDFCLSPHNKTFRGLVNHSIRQIEYAKYLHNTLNNITGVFRYIKVKANNKIYDECSFTIKPNIQLETLYNDFYGDFGGKKDVPYNLSSLTPLAIAIWFMDDGFLLNNGHSKTLGFSTCNFSLEGLLRLQKFLKEKYSIETIIRKNFYLIVKKSSALTLYNLISPSIIDSMKYKIALD
jgi:recombination protein RecA